MKPPKTIITIEWVSEVDGPLDQEYLMALMTTVYNKPRLVNRSSIIWKIFPYSHGTCLGVAYLLLTFKHQQIMVTKHFIN